MKTNVTFALLLMASPALAEDTPPEPRLITVEIAPSRGEAASVAVTVAPNRCSEVEVRTADAQHSVSLCDRTEGGRSLISFEIERYAGEGPVTRQRWKGLVRLKRGYLVVLGRGGGTTIRASE